MFSTCDDAFASCSARVSIKISSLGMAATLPFNSAKGWWDRTSCRKIAGVSKSMLFGSGNKVMTEDIRITYALHTFIQFVYAKIKFAYIPSETA